MAGECSSMVVVIFAIALKPACGFFALLDVFSFFFHDQIRMIYDYLFMI